MFGYIRPFRAELKVRDFENYQALYCSLCHSIGARHGQLARLFLTYDFTFLAMVLDAGEYPRTQRRRCPACPVRGRMVCDTTPAIETAADETIILAYWKLMDNVADGSFVERWTARILALLLRRPYRKAARFRPAFDRKVRECLEELRLLELENCSSLDRTADTFARILQAASPATGDAAHDRPVEQILYHVGRWIYLTDAWNDLEEDQARGGYNPIPARYEEGPEQGREPLRTTLKHSVNLASSAYGLTEFGCWNNTIGNILYLGIPMVEELVFTGQWRKASKLLPGGRKNNRRINT